ncbi:kinesin-like KIF22 [Crotalus adamanteus]|uniref:Kinesin-like KIF22 n=1 Tax=Crotalus adamanteus TaxID=8729 RepID=A0AAW1B1H3_CROAD
MQALRPRGLAYKKNSQGHLKRSRSVQTPVKSQEEEEGVVKKQKTRGRKKKILDFDSENKAPLEFEMKIHPDQLAHSKANILSLMNSGSVKDLMGLHFIGKKKAQLIVSWRENYGFFEKVQDLEKTHGITAKQVDSFTEANIFKCLRKLQ